MRFAREVCLTARIGTLNFTCRKAAYFTTPQGVTSFAPTAQTSLKGNDNAGIKTSHSISRFSVQIINLVISLKAKHETIISNQIGRSGTSIGANIREAQYAHGKPDFIAKLQIALKEANETGYWLELLFKTDYIDEQTYKTMDSACTSIRVMLISSINTVKQNNDN